MFNFFLKNKYNLSKRYYTSAFTIIELLVVVSIFVIITGLSIFNYKNFNSSVSTQNLADDIALTVRKAQGYAIGVRGVAINSSNYEFDHGYGVHFTSNNTPEFYNSGSNLSFILFIDINDNKAYDYNNEGKCGSPELGNECLEVLNIKTLDEINGIYLNENSNPIDKTDSLNILFKRPKPEPYFSDRFGDPLSISYIRVKVVNSNDPTKIYKIIRISNTGQISVLNQWN